MVGHSWVTAQSHLVSGDLQLVWQQYKEMGPGQLVAIGRDLSPHYWTFLQDYLKSVPSPLFLQRMILLQGCILNLSLASPAPCKD